MESNTVNEKLFVAFKNYQEEFIPQLVAFDDNSLQAEYKSGYTKPNFQELKYFANCGILEAYLYCCNDLKELVKYISDKSFTNKEIGLIAFKLSQLIFKKFSYSWKYNSNKVGFEIDRDEYNEPIFDTINKFSDELNYICDFLNINKKYDYSNVNSYNEFLENVLVKSAEYECVEACEVLAKIYKGSFYCNGEPLFLVSMNEYSVWIEFEFSDTDKSFFYLQKAAILGSKSSAWEVKELYKQEKNIVLENLWLKYSANLNCTEALYELGVKYSDMYLKTKEMNCYFKAVELIKRFLKTGFNDNDKRNKARQILSKIKKQ